MAITFYYGSGSAYSWRVWLALEHKALAYDFRLLSFAAGDLRKPAFLALNPRHKVPVIVDQDFVLYESGAIVEYLDEQYAQQGGRLLPPGIRERALARRMLLETDWYLGAAVEQLVAQLLFTPEPDWDWAGIRAATVACVGEMQCWENALKQDFFMGEPGAVDFALFPLLALLRRMERRHADLDFSGKLGPVMAAWMKRMEALPIVEKTWPPHWRGS